MNAEYTIKKQNKIWRVIVTCPFCHKTHRHGGGELTGEPILGQRGSHCGRGDYTLYDRQCLPKVTSEVAGDGDPKTT